jgi:hypothetical protein
LCVVLLTFPIFAQTGVLPAASAAFAEQFQRNAPQATALETLRQNSFRVPPHPLIAIGAAAADPMEPRFVTHEVVSEYTLGRLKGGTDLLEFRALVSLDGRSVATPDAARRALAHEARSGEDRARKRLLEELSRLGLLDVATDYGTILLAFTATGQQALRIHPAGDGWIGTEPALRFDWEQTAGGALEFRGRKLARRPLEGSIWVRARDGMPLRISSSFEHTEPVHVLRDDASVDFVLSPAGFVAPATVVHRHYVDGRALTENHYTYGPFHLFTTDTTIRYGDTVEPPGKK